MGVIRISPRVNMGQILAKQINIDGGTGTDFNYLFSGHDPIANNPGIRYNEQTSKWQFSHNGTSYSDFGTGGGGGGDGATYIIAEEEDTSGNFNVLNGSTWGVDKALIKTIIVKTTSADWDLYILQNDNGFPSPNDANIPAMQLMASGNGDETVQRDFPYEDEDASNEIHFYFIDNATSALVTVTVIGYALD